MLTISTSTPRIIDAERMTTAMGRYWYALATRLVGKVDQIDPWRNSLADLRSRYGHGLRVYRASTGGRWGKSAVIVTL